MKHKNNKKLQNKHCMDNLLDDLDQKMCNTPVDVQISKTSYRDMFVDKNVLVIGLGISGEGAVNALKQLKANVFVYAKKCLEINNINVITNKRSLPSVIIDMDLIIVSPTTKLTSKIKKIIEQHNIECIGELEFASRLCDCPILAVTGTNGKTTTTTLLNDIMQTSYNSHKLGNIGKSFASEVLNIKEDERVVLECSSFQLMQTESFHPHIACLLNLSADHLDFHKNIEEYYNAKLRIFKNMQSTDYAVVNLDDNSCYELTKQLKAQIYYFSLKQKCKGVFIQDETIMFSDGIITYSIEQLNRIPYIFKHNLSNILCAICMGILAGISIENIAEVIKEFKTPAHRIEFVRRLNGVDYYNDSKATNIDSCLTACRAFDTPLQLLLGGSDKGENYAFLSKNLPTNVKNVYLFGKTKHKMYKKLKRNKQIKIFKCKTLEFAIKLASQNSQNGDVVLLSPACASFDLFSSFEERGNFFKNIVNDL